MSCESISLRPFVPSRQPDPTIMVGDGKIADLFFEAILQYGSTTSVAKDPTVKEDGESSIFGRDWGVIGLNHTYLLPNPLLPTNMLGFEFRAYLPSHSSFVDDPLCGYGRGFYENYVREALSYMQERHLPHIQMRSTIEGGNAYVFFGPNGEPRAIVGESSVALTLLGFERQPDFEEEYQEPLENLLEAIDTPSDEAIYKARNIALFARLKGLSECQDYFEANHSTLSPQEFAKFEAYLKEEFTSVVLPYCELLAAPLTEEKGIEYYEKGRMWEAKMRLALQVIAKDLGVPLENLAIVPQTDFHIDMEMFVAPNGRDVYLNEGSMLANPTIIDELERIGCRVIAVPGVHQVDGKSINFMNGIFVSTPSGPLFVTNGTGDDELSKDIRGRFIQRVEDSFKDGDLKFRIHFLDETQEILTEQEGGIHCLTREEPNYKTPLDLTLSYVGDPVPEKRIRECAREALACLDTRLIDVLRPPPPPRQAVVVDDAHASSG